MIAQLFGNGLAFVACRQGPLQHHKRTNGFSGCFIGTTHHSGFGHQLGTADQSRFNFHRAHAVARHIQHVVNAARDGEVACFGIANGTVAGQVVLALEIGWIVAFHETLGVTPDGANHGRPWALDHQDTALAIGHVFACLVHDGGLNARKGQGARTGHHGCHTRQWRDHVATGFGLPEGVDNGAVATAHVLVIPLPRSGVDGFAHRAEQAQAAQVVALGMHRIIGFSRFDQRANGSRRRVEN